jgi:hypothetical protein
MCHSGRAAAVPCCAHHHVRTAQLIIVRASKASWADLQAIFGNADYPASPTASAS